MVRRTVLCICLLLVGGVARADSAQELSTLLERTGFDRSVRRLPEAAVQHLTRTAADRRDRVQLERSFRSAFDPEPVLEAVLAELLLRYDEASVREVLDWYGSPLGRRVREHKEHSLAPEQRESLGAFAVQFQHKLPSAERRTLVGRLDTATRAVEQATTLSVAVSLGLSLLLEGSVSDSSPLGSQPRDEETLRRKTEPVMREQMHLLLHFTTRELSLEELESYVSFTESAAFRWFRDTAFRGFEEGIESSLEKIRKEGK